VAVNSGHAITTEQLLQQLAITPQPEPSLEPAPPPPPTLTDEEAEATYREGWQLQWSSQG